MASYYTILTSVGQAKVANAVALGQKVNLSTLAVGDANGVTPQPDANAKALIHERRRAPLNRVEIDKENPNFIVCEQVLPPEVGGWEIREIGVFDDEGNLIAYGNYPPTYKPLMNEGTSRTQTVRLVMQVSDTASVTLKVDPSVVLATRQYVDDAKTENNEALEKVKRGLGEAAGMSHSNDDVAKLKGSSTEVADTRQLVELRKIFDSFLEHAGGAVTWDVQEQWDIWKQEYGSGRLAREGAVACLRDWANNWFISMIGIPLPWPNESIPEGFLACSGQYFDKSKYERLAKIYPSGQLPDLRGEFIRGWDAGRGVDAGRRLLSWQAPTGIRAATVDIYGTDVGTNIGVAYSGADKEGLSHNDSLIESPKYAKGNVFGGAAVDDVQRTYQASYGSDGTNTWFTSRVRNIAFNYIVRAI